MGGVSSPWALLVRGKRVLLKKKKFCLVSERAKENKHIGRDVVFVWHQLIIQLFAFLAFAFYVQLFKTSLFQSTSNQVYFSIVSAKS